MSELVVVLVTMVSFMVMLGLLLWISEKYLQDWIDGDDN